MDFGPASDRIIPIQIREDLTVHVSGIPHDLTTAEAERICRVVMALSSPDSKGPDHAH